MSNEVTTEIVTGYDSSHDRTIIYQETYNDDEHISTEIVGWYYGEANDEATETYTGDMLCTYD